MFSRSASASARIFTSASALLRTQPTTRAFQSTARRMDTPVVLPVRKPVGAFRGGLFGFLLGSTGAGAAVYYYILEEYRVSNELLTEDIYALQAAVQRTESYVRSLEESMVKKDKKQ